MGSPYVSSLFAQTLPKRSRDYFYWLARLNLCIFTNNWGGKCWLSIDAAKNAGEEYIGFYQYFREWLQ